MSRLIKWGKSFAEGSWTAIKIVALSSLVGFGFVAGAVAYIAFFILPRSTP
ncbi:hypothetical protein [Pseudomonas sp.]|uniref:hypothetical protein n=1 Tax=Pseudomonas sp. TaxID=306 RepID=UPI003D10CD07